MAAVFIFGHEIQIYIMRSEILSPASFQIFSLFQTVQRAKSCFGKELRRHTLCFDRLIKTIQSEWMSGYLLITVTLLTCWGLHSSRDLLTSNPTYEFSLRPNMLKKSAKWRILLEWILWPSFEILYEVQIVFEHAKFRFLNIQCKLINGLRSPFVDWLLFLLTLWSR